MRVKSVLNCAGLFFALLLLGGCASLKPDTRTDAEIVADRAQQRLDALLARDLKGAWEFTTPAHRRSFAPGTYNRRVAGAASWTAASVKSVDCEEDRCDVVSSISYRMPRLKLENTRPVNEVWIKVDGQWWIYHR